MKTEIFLYRVDNMFIVLFVSFCLILLLTLYFIYKSLVNQIRLTKITTLACNDTNSKHISDLVTKYYLDIKCEELEKEIFVLANKLYDHQKEINNKLNNFCTKDDFRKLEVDLETLEKDREKLKEDRFAKMRKAFGEKQADEE